MTTTMMRSREENIALLIVRDGLRCTYPNCEEPFGDGKWLLTIDHIIPQSEMRAAGFSEEEINDLDNLQLMHRTCNGKKSNFMYDEDGNLPVHEPRVRVDKSTRVIVCNLCDSGRKLVADQLCDLCGSEAQPKTWPKWAQKRPKDCSHGWEIASDHCWMCVTGMVERKSAMWTIIEGPE